MDNRPIGLFDSGVGGLTVLKSLINLLDKEDYIYFGDNMRMPYGNKKKEEIVRFSRQISRFLQKKDIKALVIACNTASSLAYKEIVDEFDMPIILSILDEGVKMTLEEDRDKRVSFIATENTVKSGRFEKRIYEKDKDRKIRSIACKEFAEIVENNLIDDENSIRIYEKYLNPIKDNTDLLVLGCTHYPILMDRIKDIMKSGVKYIDPAIGLAKTMKKALEEKDMLSDSLKGSVEYYYTKDESNFKLIGEKFLALNIDNIKKVSLDELNSLS